MAREPYTLPPLPPVSPTEDAIAQTPTRTLDRVAQEPRRIRATVAASGALLPLVYGRTRIGGQIFASGTLSGDLVVGVAWCLGEIEEVEEVYINDAAVPVAVTLTHYTGTASQTADATLTSAIAGYADDLVASIHGTSYGIAYTVARIPTGELSGWPRFQAIIKGRKVYDPRTASTAYSENTALCLRDLLASADYGLGVTVSGADEAADWCDTLVDTDDPRCRIGLAMLRPARAWDWAQTLKEYAECFLVWEGAALRMIPDQPVASPVATYTEADILADSLAVTVRDLSGTPTVAEVRYTVTTADAAPWGTSGARSVRPGVNDGSTPYVPTTPRMEGITRASEAQRKADQRLSRSRIALEVSFTAFDAGVMAQRGDVIRLNHGPRNLDVELRIVSVSARAPGRYEVRGEGYSDELYSNAEGGEAGGEGASTVPEGVIGILATGASVPGGWTLYTAADGNWIIGAGDTYAVAATGGSLASLSLADDVDTGGGHTGTPFNAALGENISSSGPAVRGTDTAGTSHVHSFSTDGVTPDPPYARRRLVIKDASAASLAPKDVLSLVKQTLADPNFEVVSPSGNRWLQAGASEATGGSVTATTPSTTTSSAGAHNHGLTPRPEATGGEGASAPGHNSASNHAHSVAIDFTLNPRRVRLALMAGGVDYAIQPGMIFMWSGSLGSLPTGWQLCDGTGPTPDLRNRFVELTGIAEAGAALGDDTAYWSGQTTGSAGAHTHVGSSIQAALGTISVKHSSHGSHVHTITDGSVAFQPPYYALAFIMYTGA